MRILFVSLFLSLSAYSQSDSTQAVPLLSVHFGALDPAGDLNARFGPALEAGGTFSYKTYRNWMIGLDASYIFGKQVKEKVLSQLINSDGFVTDNEGYPADIRLTERGISLQATIGKLIPVKKNNPNSGLQLRLGMGYLWHKVHIYDAQKKVAAVSGDLIKGYDRLTGGFSLQQFIGYMHLSRNRLNNFYGGLEFTEAFTSSLRKLNYSDGMPDTARRFDVLFGFRLGWILPLYKKAPNEFYEY